MSLALVLGIGALGGCGAVARVLLDHAIERRTGTDFPWGILFINVVGSFGLGLLVGSADHVYRLVGIGFVGAFTTFSTWMLDTRKLPPAAAAANVVVSLGLGLLAARIGMHL